MMNKIEEAIIYATVMHQGKVRKLGNIPYILHPLEVHGEFIIHQLILHTIVFFMHINTINPYVDLCMTNL